jgi:heterodisulfide reductase subunit C
MIDPSLGPRLPTLRQAVLVATGQDVRKCQQCAYCDVVLDEAQDLSLATLVQLVVMNDDEILTSRTLWSGKVLASARHLCASSLNLEAVILALRAEARRRGLSMLDDGALPVDSVSDVID